MGSRIHDASPARQDHIKLQGHGPDADSDGNGMGLGLGEGEVSTLWELSAWTRELGRQVSPTHRERPFQTHTRCDSSESPRPSCGHTRPRGTNRWSERMQEAGD